MEVFKTFVLMDDGIYEMDTIEYNEKLWLVPEWIDTPRKGWSKPSRIVCLSLLAYSQLEEKYFLQGNPIPKSVFFGQIPPQLAIQYVVIDFPDIEVETHSFGVIH